MFAYIVRKISYLNCSKTTLNKLHQQKWSLCLISCRTIEYTVWRLKISPVKKQRGGLLSGDLLSVHQWNELSQRFIDRSIDEWRRRLIRVVQQQGGHTEHITL